jgi:hypothetical protein
VGKGILGQELFDGTDGNRLRHAIKDARALAQAFGGTHPHADFRQVGDRAEHGRGFEETAFGGQKHPLRDGIAQRATGDATGVRTLDTTAGLLAGGGLVVEAVDFEEVGHAFRR